MRNMKKNEEEYVRFARLGNIENAAPYVRGEIHLYLCSWRDTNKLLAH